MYDSDSEYKYNPFEEPGVSPNQGSASPSTSYYTPFNTESEFHSPFNNPQTSATDFDSQPSDWYSLFRPTVKDELPDQVSTTVSDETAPSNNATAEAATTVTAIGAPENERPFVPVSTVQRAKLRKKWRQHIKTGAPHSRADYANWFAEEVLNLKEDATEIMPTADESSRLTKRRIQSDNSSVPPQPAIKRRRDDVGTVKLVIVDCDYPHSSFDANQADAIKESLLQALDRLALDDNANRVAPNFQEIRHIGGALHVSCKTEDTAKWLMEVVPNLQPWDAAKITVTKAEDLVRFVKGVVYMPFSNLHQEVVLRRLAIQNAGLNTRVWRFVQMRQEKVGQTMVVYVDEKSAEHLRKEDGLVALNFTQLKFRLHGQDGDKEHEAPTKAFATATVTGEMEPAPRLQMSVPSQSKRHVSRRSDCHDRRGDSRHDRNRGGNRHRHSSHERNTFGRDRQRSTDSGKSSRHSPCRNK